MHAATQQQTGTIAPAVAVMRGMEAATPRPHEHNVPRRLAPVMTVHKPRQVFIQGITTKGQTFRPSDWAERLAGAMSCFRPGGGAGGIGAFIGYSPYCVPQLVNGVKGVIVSEALKDIEPMAWDFVMNFARDNELQLADICVLPDTGAQAKPQ
jgi:hypothetical protein